MLIYIVLNMELYNCKNEFLIFFLIGTGTKVFFQLLLNPYELLTIFYRNS